MKQYVIIPVAYFISGHNVYETVVYVGKLPADYRGNLPADCQSEAGGNKELQDYLNKGWKIHSVQTVPLSSTGNSRAIIQYILESP